MLNALKHIDLHVKFNFFLSTMPSNLLWEEYPSPNRTQTHPSALRCFEPPRFTQLRAFGNSIAQPLSSSAKYFHKFTATIIRVAYYAINQII